MRIQFQSFHQHLPMLLAHLMSEDTVNVFILPVQFCLCLLPGLFRQTDARVQQCFGIRLHAGPTISVNTCFDPTGTKVVLRRV